MIYFVTNNEMSDFDTDFTGIFIYYYTCGTFNQGFLQIETNTSVF